MLGRQIVSRRVSGGHSDLSDRNGAGDTDGRRQTAGGLPHGRLDARTNFSGWAEQTFAAGMSRKRFVEAQASTCGENVPNTSMICFDTS